MLYNTSISGSTAPPVTRLFDGASTVTITGHALSRSLCGKSPAQRAALAASAMGGDFTIVNPTVGQITRIYGISVPTLNKARALSSGARSRVAAGKRPLITARDRMQKAVGEIRSEADVEQFIIEVGLERTLNALDRLTAPLADAAE